MWIFIYCAYLIQKYFSLENVSCTFNTHLTFYGYCLKNQIIQATEGNTTTNIWLSNKVSSQVLILHVANATIS